MTANYCKNVLTEFILFIEKKFSCSSIFRPQKLQVELFVENLHSVVIWREHEYRIHFLSQHHYYTVVEGLL